MADKKKRNSMESILRKDILPGRGKKKSKKGK